MNLEARLKKVVEADPDKYSPESIMRVHQFILWTEENPEKRKPWQGFEEIIDFELYYNTNLDLKEKTPGELSTRDNPEGTRFYTALNKFCDSEAGSDNKKKDELINRVINKYRLSWKYLKTADEWFKEKEKHREWSTFTITDMMKFDEESKSFHRCASRWARLNLEGVEKSEFMKKLFSPQRQNWNQINTVKDWQNGYSTHPEWAEMSRNQLKRDKKTGGSEFYCAVNAWCKNNATTAQERKKLRDMILPESQKKSYSHMTKIEDWKKEFSRHPNWKDRTRKELKLSHDSLSFYLAFTKWCKIEGKNSKEQKILRDAVLPQPERDDWARFNTLNEWNDEYISNPKLTGKSPGEIELIPEGRRFQRAFKKWCKRTTKSEKESCELYDSLFGKTKKGPHYKFNKNTCRFGSRSERIITILLNKYGILKNPEERKNIHVRTNGKKQHNLDFLVGNTFIEYHPVTRFEREKGLTFEDVFEIRWNNITNPEYQQHWFWMIQDLDGLYEVLQDREIKPLMYERYQNLTYEQFEEHVNQAYAKAREYDLAQEKKKIKPYEQPHGLSAPIPISHGELIESKKPTNDDIELADEVAA